MKDRTLKGLLAAIAALLLVNLLRPGPSASPLQAQAVAPARPGTAQMIVGDRMIYILRDDQLSVCYVDFGVKNPFELLGLMNEGKIDEILKKSKLQLLLQQDLNRLGPAAAK